MSMDRNRCSASAISVSTFVDDRNDSAFEDLSHEMGADALGPRSTELLGKGAPGHAFAAAVEVLCASLLRPAHSVYR